MLPLYEQGGWTSLRYTQLSGEEDRHEKAAKLMDDEGQPCAGHCGWDTSAGRKGSHALSQHCTGDKQASI